MYEISKGSMNRVERRHQLRFHCRLCRHHQHQTRVCLTGIPSDLSEAPHLRRSILLLIVSHPTTDFETLTDLETPEQKISRLLYPGNLGYLTVLQYSDTGYLCYSLVSSQPPTKWPQYFIVGPDSRLVDNTRGNNNYSICFFV